LFAKVQANPSGEISTLIIVLLPEILLQATFTVPPEVNRSPVVSSKSS
jgi:hypothetical protein